MFPYKTSIHIDRGQRQPVYLQLANQLIALIKSRKLAPETKLPGSRTLADLLNVHRKTIVACYDELMLQGWLESIPKKGTFVHRNLPEYLKQDFSSENQSYVSQTGFSYYEQHALKDAAFIAGEKWTKINDGVSDERLAPVQDLARIYRRITAAASSFDLSYGSTFGNDSLREALVSYLNKTRGLQISKAQLLITRGSQMGIFLSAQLLLRENDLIIVGSTNYNTADITFEYQRAKLLRVSVDDHGLNTNEIERLCKSHAIKAVYITSHHHHPTGVTLSAERRLHLLNLAKKYNFAIIEDDYDYDFNFNHAPILPLASHDLNGHVVYIGSVCKTVAPVFRIGYMIAPPDFISEAARLRRIVDRQGDALLELTFAQFIRSGDLDRHIRKVLKIYRYRRDLFCSLLKNELSQFFSFDIPMGGMAVWIRLNKNYNWQEVARSAQNFQLEIGNWRRYDRAKTGHNAIRIGFATYNEQEIYSLVEKLKKTMDHLRMVN